jgi:Protein of unknown function (DUF1552)
MKSFTCSRRTALRGLGISIALPLFESWFPARAFALAKEPPRRLIFLYAPNGKHMADWAPAARGPLAEMPPLLKGLTPWRDQLRLLSGLSLREAAPGGDGPGDHARAMATFLTGVRPHKTSGADVRAGISVDQVAAAALGNKTRLPSLELGCEGGKSAGVCDNGYSCAYQTNLSWRSAQAPMPKEINPRVVFERLFGAGSTAEARAAASQRDAENKSILDFVAEDTRYVRQRLGLRDRSKLDEYLTSVREVEARLQRAQPTIAIGDQKLIKPTGVPADFKEHARQLTDLMVLSLRTDLTRISTFVIGNDGSNRSYREVGVFEGHHDTSHHGNDPAKLDKLRRINCLHLDQLANLLASLSAIREGEQTLLDSTLVLYGSGIRDGDRHDHDDLPILLAGGGNRLSGRGQHLAFATGTPLANLHLTLLDWIGAPKARFGDSTGRLMSI